LDLLLHLVG